MESYETSEGGLFQKRYTLNCVLEAADEQRLRAAVSSFELGLRKWLDKRKARAEAVTVALRVAPLAQPAARDLLDGALAGGGRWMRMLGEVPITVDLLDEQGEPLPAENPADLGPSNPELKAALHAHRDAPTDEGALGALGAALAGSTPILGAVEMPPGVEVGSVATLEPGTELRVLESPGRMTSVLMAFTDVRELQAYRPGVDYFAIEGAELLARSKGYEEVVFDSAGEAVQLRRDVLDRLAGAG